MATVRRGSKAHILQLLKRAEKSLLEEQDRYLEILTRAESPTARKEIFTEIQNKGWKAVHKAMKGCTFPPSLEDRRTYLKISGGEELAHCKLNGIADAEIRHRSFFLNSLIEYTQQMGALANWYERVGTLQNRGAGLFSLWSTISGLRVLHEEAVLMGKDNEAKTIQSLMAANDKAASMLFEMPWSQEMADRAARALEKIERKRQHAGTSPIIMASAGEIH